MSSPRLGYSVCYENTCCIRWRGGLYTRELMEWEYNPSHLERDCLPKLSPIIICLIIYVQSTASQPDYQLVWRRFFDLDWKTAGDHAVLYWAERAVNYFYPAVSLFLYITHRSPRLIISNNCVRQTSEPGSGSCRSLLSSLSDLRAICSSKLHNLWTSCTNTLGENPGLNHSLGGYHRTALASGRRWVDDRRLHGFPTTLPPPHEH